MRPIQHKIKSRTGIIVFLTLLYILIILPSSAADPKGVEGYVYNPLNGRANNASVKIHVTASVGIGLTIPCTTQPAVLTNSIGYYITNLANLKRDDNNNDCGSLWFTGDSIWAIVNGSTAKPYPYGNQNSSPSAIPEMSGVTISLTNVTLNNLPPTLTSVYAPATNGGNMTTVITNATDNGDNLSIFCCFDTSNTCTPTIAANQCSGNWENVTYPYTNMNCTYTVPSGVETTYYVRCRVKDFEYQTGIASASFIVDSFLPVITDDFTKNNTWVNSNQIIALNPDCSLVLCNWTYYCIENDTCTPHINYSSPISFSNENLSYLKYQTQDMLGKTTDLTSYIIKIDKGSPLKDNAAVTVENDSEILTNTTVLFNWTGFSDNLSGIIGYYYSFTNNEGTTGGTFDADSPGVLTNSPQGLIHVYVWAVDAAGNIGLSVNDGILTDSEGPASGIYNISEDYGGGYIYYNIPTATLCYADQAAGFTIQVNAADPNGINNATGTAAFGDSPSDNTPVSGGYQFELSYTIEAPTPVIDSINISVYDNLSNRRLLTLNLLKDIYSPGNAIITDNLAFWSPNTNVDLIWDNSFDQCGVSGYFWNVDNGTNTTTTTALRYANTTGNAQGNHTFYLYATDNMANTGLVGAHDFGVDTSSPPMPANMQDSGEFDNDGSFTLTWDAVTDISGITYEIFERDNGAAWASIQNTSLTTSNVNGRLNSHNYTYIVRARNGAGLLSGNSTQTDGILVDTTRPYIKNVVNDPINQTYAGSMTVNATVGDSVSGFNMTPMIKYKHGNDAWSSAYNMTNLAGNESEGNYTYEIPQPGSGWQNYRGQQVYWNITLTDKTGNINQTQYNTTVTSINTLTFNVRDRILGLGISNVNLSGGTQCAAGCIFSDSIGISELNGAYTFTIKKDGFSTNTTAVNVQTQDLTLNVSLDDVQAPSVSFLNYSYSAVSNTSFYAKVYANISENLNLDRSFLNYTLTEGISEAGQANFSLVSGTIYLATLGPYNGSFLMRSNMLVNDSYGLDGPHPLTDVWYVFAGGTGTCGVTVTYTSDDRTLVFDDGWSIISVPFLDNYSIENVLAGLGNGNWGCGRDARIPIQCNASAEDYIGNFTKIMAYNATDSSWATFNPTDFYLAMGSEPLRTLQPKKGYWINMTQSQNLTLDLKFD